MGRNVITKRHKLTKEENSRGGRASTIAKKLSHRKNVVKTALFLTVALSQPLD